MKILHGHRIYLFDALHEDEQGTTLTEFMMTLPIFIMVFIGILTLGDLTVASVTVEADAHRDVFSRARTVQTNANPLNVHIAPVTAGVDASLQVENFKPRQTGGVQQGIRALEHSTYSLQGMVMSGHWGESNSRVQPLGLLGVKPRGMFNDTTEAPTGYYRDVVGDSVLAGELVYDGPLALNFDTIDAISGADSVVQAVVNGLNAFVTSTGSRAGLAAGMRYGTVTGREQITGSAFNNWDYEYSAYHTVTVAPHVHGDSWFDAMRATTVTRFTMFSYPHLQRTLGFDDGADRLNIDDYPQVPVPDHEDVGFGNHLIYDATLYE
ncbi:MAG: TadE/TadG family type IV pilus assembly protein [Bradymonadaceae bacterium]